MPRALAKIVRNGNSTQITIPRELRIHLGWLAGEAVILEALQDGTLSVRRPSDRDFAPRGLQPRVLLDGPEATK